MNTQFLIYKHVRKQTPYAKYIKEKQEIQRKKERRQFYEQILKFNQSRYPEDLMNQLEREINPFQLSLDKLKEVYNVKFPQYANELVHEAVEFVFKMKCRQSQMIRNSSLVIQYGDENIRNGRKLQKEDFSYFFQRMDTQKKLSDLSISARGMNTDREKEDNTMNSKYFQEIQVKTERFNNLLMKAINDEKDKFENIQLIEENNPKDSLFYKQPTSRRDLVNNSFPLFKESDMIVRPDAGLQTGRSDIQELNMLLGGLTRRDQEQFGEITGRSRGSSYAVKINKEVMDNLYNARGKLKLDLVKRVVNKFKREKQQ